MRCVKRLLLRFVVAQAVGGSRGIPSSCSFPVCCRGTPPSAESTSGSVTCDNRVDVASTCSDDVTRRSSGRSVPAADGAAGSARHGGSAPGPARPGPGVVGRSVDHRPRTEISGRTTRAAQGRLSSPSQIAGRLFEQATPTSSADDLTLSVARASVNLLRVVVRQLHDDNCLTVHVDSSPQPPYGTRGTRPVPLWRTWERSVFGPLRLLSSSFSWA